MSYWKITGLTATVIIILIIPISIFKKVKPLEDKSDAYKFVGVQKCIECHINEYNSWSTSHHAHAMAVANDSSVRGDFNNVEGGNTWHFYYLWIEWIGNCSRQSHRFCEKQRDNIQFLVG